MEVTIIISGIMAVLFGAAFVTKRRFGLLGAALILGYVLQQAWQQQLPGWASGIELPVDTVLSPLVIISMGIILMPSMLLLGGGPTYTKKLARVIGAAEYAVFAILLCSSAVQDAVVAGFFGEVSQFFAEYQQYIITLVIVLIVIDLVQMYSGVSRRAKLPKH